MSFLTIWLVPFALLFSLPAYILLLEVSAAVLLDTRVGTNSDDESTNSRCTVAFLVPAHNEGESLVPTIADIKLQSKDGDRILVVADNCSDDTASIAARAGAEVVQRHNLTQLGKGYALDHGIGHLRQAPPDVVLIIDADCRLAPDAVDHLIAVCCRTDRPAQALYLMEASSKDSAASAVAFYWRIKNWVRPLGLSNLGMPCQLVGTGMAIPWNLISLARLANGSIVEDLAAGLNLTMAGHAPVFCASAIVTSQFAASEEGKTTQRERWEHGHLGIIRSLPKLIYWSVRGGNLDLLILALDLAVPPLSLLALLLLAMTCVSLALTVSIGSLTPLIICVGGLCSFAIAVTMSWIWFGRDLLPASGLVATVVYTAKKVPFYLKLLFNGRVSEWKRTDRSKPPR